MEIKLGDLTKRQILNICDTYSDGSPHCSKQCPLYRNKKPLCRSYEESDFNIEIKFPQKENNVWKQKNQKF